MTLNDGKSIQPAGKKIKVTYKSRREKRISSSPEPNDLVEPINPTLKLDDLTIQTKTKQGLRKRGIEIDAFKLLNTDNKNKTIKKAIVDGKAKATSLHDKEQAQQWFLSVGQKDNITCPDCGMSYTKGIEDDEKFHLQYHQSIKNGFIIRKYKNEVTIKENISLLSTMKEIPIKSVGPTTLDSFFKVKPKIKSVSINDTDKKENNNLGMIVSYSYHRLSRFELQKIDEIVHLVNQSLGAGDIDKNRLIGSKIYLFLNWKREVLGCCVGEPIVRGYPINQINPSLLLSDQSSINLTHSNTPLPASIGINRIYTNPNYRRQNIASQLLNAIAETFYYGSCPISPEKIAFSQPTTSGYHLAVKFTNNFTFLVYNDDDVALPVN